jgi:PAS domain S-box-containing protein
LSKTEHNNNSAFEFLHPAKDRLDSNDLAPFTDGGTIAEPQHFVQFYETDDFLLDSLSDYINAGLSAGEVCIVVATDEHLRGLEERLAANEKDLVAAKAEGLLTLLQADETLAKFMFEGLPELERFNEVIGGLVAQATQSHRRVRIFGEMVAILWAEGNQQAALRLEELWNGLHKSYPFQLLCGYPLNSFAQSEFAEAFGEVCARHSRVIPAESYTALSHPADRLRAITMLQQKATALQHKLIDGKKTEALLQAWEIRYRRLFELSADGILIIDAESHTIVDANPSMTLMLGIPLTEIIGKELWQIGLLENSEANLRLWQELKEKQVVHYEHLTLKAENGRKHFIDFICNNYQTNGHQVIQCNIRDITERRAAEEISMHLAAIVESSDDAIISKTLAGIILSWNRGAERIFGYTAEEVIGKSITILIPPERLSEETTIIKQLKLGKRIDHYETVRIAKDGSQVDISLSVSPIRDKAGNIIAASKVARNITEQRRAERKLRENAEIIKTINLTLQQLSADLNVQNIIRTVTQASTEFTGAQLGAFFYNIQDDIREADKLYTFEGIYKKTFNNFPLPQNADLFDKGGSFESQRIDDVNRNPLYDKSSPFYGIPASQLPVASYLAVPVLSNSGKVIGSLYFAHGQPGIFTERHQRIVEGIASQAAIALDNAKLYELAQLERAKAEEANRLKDEFLATVSHELRTPLNAIIGWSHMLNRGNLNRATIAHALQTIERNARSQAQLIEDILDVSRVITGKLRLKEEAVDIVSIISAAIDSVQLSADAKAIGLKVILDPSVRHISGDANRLQQVIWNLLSNAIKFTGTGGSVEVRLERGEATAQIVVKDSGEGIRKDFLPFIFERFRQADGTTTRRNGGLGLGLAIVRHLIELHGGTVQAHSEGEGQGATFIIRLPLDVQGSRASNLNKRVGTISQLPKQQEINNFLPSLNGVQIVVVDDDPDTLEMLTTVLSGSGAQVRAATSAAEALETLQQYRPDILVSDLAMPLEDGYSLIRKIRALEVPGDRQIPAVALTAYVRVEDRAHALSAGFNMFVPKPIEPNELINAIANLAAGAALQDSLS